MNIELFITFLSVLDKLNDCELTRIIVSKWMDVVWFWPTRCSLPHSLSLSCFTKRIDLSEQPLDLLQLSGASHVMHMS